MYQIPVKVIDIVNGLPTPNLVNMYRYIISFNDFV